MAPTKRTVARKKKAAKTTSAKKTVAARAQNNLAPGEAPWMYTPMDADVREVLDFMGTCRDPKCLVPQYHPYYHGEVLDPPGDPMATKVPCMPVIPVQTVQGKIMVIGDYPTAKFTARDKDNKPVSFAKGAGGRDGNQYFVPVADIWAPMQDAYYFDGYKTRSVASGTYFNENYLGVVGVNSLTDVWMTNLIKCYLFHQRNVDSYKVLGWDDVPVKASYDNVFDIANVCWQRNLQREIEVCKPQLIITVGEWSNTITQGLPEAIKGAGRSRAGRAYWDLLGVPLRANKVSPKEKQLDCPRIDPFMNYNMMHLLHPENVMISQTDLQNCDWDRYRESAWYRRKIDGAGSSIEKHLSTLKSLGKFLAEINYKTGTPHPDKTLQNLVRKWKREKAK